MPKYIKPNRRSKPSDFWKRVQIKGQDECWEWQGQLMDNRPYGKVKYHQQHWSAHRLAYTLANGEIPEGMNVCHACDNPKCCNPSHLWLGTHADNNKDRTAKGRSAKGESHRSAKLTPSAVTEIREKYASGQYSQEALSKIYGIAQTGIGYIVRRKHWKHVP